VRGFKGDLHIHTCLSPCADLEMSPLKVVKRAVERGLEIIAICDHNSAKNTPYAFNLSKKFPIVVLPGIEVNSVEEVHILSIFDTPEKALLLQEYVYKGINGKNDEELFGVQAVVNEFDEVEEIEDKLLISACSLSVDEIVRKTHSLGGIAIASHIDREAYSIIGKLGFIPPDLDLDGVEISKMGSIDLVPKGWTAISSSDAHYLDEIGEVWTVFYADSPDINGIKKAIKNGMVKIYGRNFSSHP